MKDQLRKTPQVTWATRSLSEKLWNSVSAYFSHKTNLANIKPMKKTFLLSVFCLLTLLLAAQIDNFKSGYILTNHGDTIFGKIDFRTNLSNQQQCKFLPDGNPTEKLYKPGDIEGYFFTDDGKYYVSKNLVIKEDTLKVFAEYLVKGMLNLYYYEYDDKHFSYNDNYTGYQGFVPYYFFEEESGKIYSFKQNPDSIYEATRLTHDDKYKGFLKYYFRDIPVIAEEAYNLKFNQASFIKVARQYHDAVCTTDNECIVFQNQHPDELGIVCTFAPYIGIQLSSYQRNYSYRGTIGRVYLQTIPAPVGGLEFTVMNPRLTNYFAGQIDVSLSYFSNPDIENLGTSDHKPVYKFSALAPTIHAGLQFIYPKYRFCPTLGAGGSLTRLLLKKIHFAHSILVDYPAKTQNFGVYVYGGFDYKLPNNHSLIFRLNYDYAPKGDDKQYYGNDNITILSTKIGYSF